MTLLRSLGGAAVVGLRGCGESSLRGRFLAEAIQNVTIKRNLDWIASAKKRPRNDDSPQPRNPTTAASQ